VLLKSSNGDLFYDHSSNPCFVLGTLFFDVYSELQCMN
jgi:hypothetical protein